MARRHIVYRPAAQRDLKAMPKEEAAAVMSAVDRFAETGDGNVKKLRNDPDQRWRLRWGKWRVLFTSTGQVIRVLRVRDRREAYR
jgi:mRNA-degrading endonuclease RelE of RelBE toxin-antitoxin system